MHVPGDETSFIVVDILRSSSPVILTFIFESDLSVEYNDHYEE